MHEVRIVTLYKNENYGKGDNGATASVDEAVYEENFLMKRIEGQTDITDRTGIKDN